MISVILPTHNPHPGRLQRTLAGLWDQTLPSDQWELVLVDNASTSPVSTNVLPSDTTNASRIIQEPALGLSQARRRGFQETRGDIIVLVDDDNVLAPDYLEVVVSLFATHPKVGVLGGSSRPEFEQASEPWVREFDSLLACRDLGAEPLISTGLRNSITGRNEYPLFAPIGAGMALRRAALMEWIDQPGNTGPSDRRGTDLSSGGDNDIILTAMKADWEVGYFPALSLIHLIPRSRLDPRYLARLNRSIAKSWVQVLHRHDACPWSPIPRWTVPLRQAKSWLKHRAWTSPAAHIRWQGACGHFEGRVESRGT